MGMYTEFYFRAFLKEEASELADWLESEKPWEGVKFDDHEFFSCARWVSIFCSGGAVYQHSHPKIFRRVPYSGECELFIHSSLKNYCSEIDQFLDWIRPFVSDRYGDMFLGYTLYEEDDVPTLHFLDRGDLYPNDVSPGGF